MTEKILCPNIESADGPVSYGPLAKLDEKNIEYNGVKMTEYEASQVQRKIEREIRKQKRTVAALEAAGEDASEYRSKLRAAQKSYTDFAAQTGLKKQQARTQAAMGTQTATPSRAEKMAQNDDTVAVPERYLDNYDDFEELSVDTITKKALQTLREKSRESGHEYGVIIQNGKASEPFTSGKADEIGFSLDNLKGGVEVYHSHTNVTPPSAQDFAILLNEKVEKFGNIAYNSDAFIVSVGSGWIPTVDEFNGAVDEIARAVNWDMMSDPDFMSWTIPERNYAAIREQAYRIARYFGWTMEGGKIDE